MTRMLLILACLLGLQPAHPARAEDQPNIVVFVSDDHRADLLGCAGHPVARTPNLDRIAANGHRFSNAFVTTSICAASRATILTGLTERTQATRRIDRKAAANLGDTVAKELFRLALGAEAELLVPVKLEAR